MQAVDVWSLGVVAFALAFSIFPFASATGGDRCFRHVKQAQEDLPARSTVREIVRFYGHRCELSQSTVDLIDALLQVKASRRASVEAVARSLADGRGGC